MGYAQRATITVSAVACSLVAVGLLLMPAAAQANTIAVWVYAAKAVCEDETVFQQSVPISVETETEINIHNPFLHKKQFFWKATYAHSIFETNSLGNGPTIYPAWIYGDGVISIDCDDIPRVTLSSEFEGFVVILSRSKLDIVGVYEVELANGIELQFDVDVVPVAPPNRINVPSTTHNAWKNNSPPTAL